jgi:NUMOD4 motif
MPAPYNFNQETWKPVKGFEQYYHVSSMGRVKALQRLVAANRRGQRMCPEIIVKPRQDTDGSLRVTLSSDGHRIDPRVNRLVAEHFIPNPQKLSVVAWINGNHADNRVENLCWVMGGRKPQRSCKRGHEFTPENTVVRSDGTRACKRCKKLWQDAHPDKVKASQKKHRRLHYDKVVACERRNNARRYQEISAMLAHAKDVPCADCGKRYPSYVMDFDHRDGRSKSFGIGNSRARSVQRFRDEIAKCDVVCANCHRERTHKLIEDRKAVRRGKIHD